MYTIRDYQKGFEEMQAAIGQEVARHWTWPYAYDLEDLLAVHAQPDFDPETRHYCFAAKKMVGYIFSVIKDAGITAELDFPRVLSGHEGAANLLMDKAFETLQKKGVERVTGRVSTMDPAGIELAERHGFSIRDWEYKLYYSYEMAWGKLRDASAEEITPWTDLDECAALATHWYKRPLAWCRSLLEEWHKVGLIAHLGIREQDDFVAACMVAKNNVRPSTAGIYYLHAPNEAHLKALLATVIEKCVDYGSNNVIADLVNEQRQFEHVYRELGFKKVAAWAKCEKEM